MKIKKIYFSILLTSIIYSSAIEANAISFKKDYGKEVQAIKMDKNLDMKSFSVEKAEELAQKYKNITKDLRLMLALDIMKECAANFSYCLILLLHYFFLMTNFYKSIYHDTINDEVEIKMFQRRKNEYTS